MSNPERKAQKIISFKLGERPRFSKLSIFRSQRSDVVVVYGSSSFILWKERKSLELKLFVKAREFVLGKYLQQRLLLMTHLLLLLSQNSFLLLGYNNSIRAKASRTSRCDSQRRCKRFHGVVILMKIPCTASRTPISELILCVVFPFTAPSMLKPLVKSCASVMFKCETLLTNMPRRIKLMKFLT